MCPVLTMADRRGQDSTMAKIGVAAGAAVEVVDLSTVAMMAAERGASEDDSTAAEVMGDWGNSGGNPSHWCQQSARSTTAACSSSVHALPVLA